MISTGERFGRLRALSDGSARDRVLCECDCGKTTAVLANNLRRGRSKSCGCRRNEVTAERNRSHATHGHSAKPSPEYRSWSAMIARCTNPLALNFAKYGGRGIGVCERWRDFALFLADMGPRPVGTSIDRIDGRKGYEPGNCRWATPYQQRHNRVS